MRLYLTRARQNRKMSQQQLAETVGLKSKASISLLERGLQKGSIELWESIAEALGYSLADLREQCNE